MIEVRCKAQGCGTLLGRLSERELRTGGEATVEVPPCRRCSVDRPRPRRFEKWARRRVGVGDRPPFQITVALRLDVDEVLAEIDANRRAGKPNAPVTV